MTSLLLYKQLFVYLIPFNVLIGEYNLGMQYRIGEEWAVDLNLGYVDDTEGALTAELYQDILQSGVFYYHGPLVKVSALSLVPRGPNPLKTDYNQLEFACRFLRYDNLDFEDENEPGKLFNISEQMKAVSLSWKAGYIIVPRNTFEMNGFVGFGIQTRFKNTIVNSYGTNYQSNVFILNDVSSSIQFVPLFHAGIKIGLKTPLKESSQ
ncbi:MAG TPA: hypothetical protein PLL28_10100 [Chitinophagales bacterium]|nr:hypothetical protein [Chitinophagales bacterium]HMZ90410.1 hypothetical protein [Chitinophagales bacterium]HNE46541.1 hypothetical protein [Chitinophagales bacterium]HNF69718.1 hypothetical protein [Chitinophagales bacterium]HNJ90102.1 hypothetical protein [Chitinophagales bacterium]